MEREIKTIENYKGYIIAKEIDHHYSEITYICYYVLDDNNLPIGGSLLSVESCKRWIDFLIRDKERKEKNDE